MKEFFGTSAGCRDWLTTVVALGSQTLYLALQTGQLRLYRILVALPQSRAQAVGQSGHRPDVVGVAATVVLWVHVVAEMRFGTRDVSLGCCVVLVGGSIARMNYLGRSRTCSNSKAPSVCRGGCIHLKQV